MKNRTMICVNESPTASHRGLRQAGVASLVLVALALLASCGGSGPTGSTGSSVGYAVNAAFLPDNELTITTDEYGLQTPNFYYTTDNELFWSVQADIATDVHDPDFRCVLRIDIPKSGGALPAFDRSYVLPAGSSADAFPGTFFVFNGHQSIKKKVEQGSLSFSSANNGVVEGTFDVVMTDYDSRLVPPPQYRFAGTFRFKIGSYGRANPLPAEVFPQQGKALYDGLCAGCHGLGEYDTSRESASDLSMRGGELPQVFPGNVSQHQEVFLNSEDVQPLRVFLNAW